MRFDLNILLLIIITFSNAIVSDTTSLSHTHRKQINFGVQKNLNNQKIINEIIFPYPLYVKLDISSFNLTLKELSIIHTIKSHDTH